MSRSIIGLLCRAWYGDWAKKFYYDNKNLRERWRRKRRKQDEREARMLIEDADE